jgi:hypothetical protein
LFLEILNMAGRLHIMYGATDARFAIAQAEFTNATAN